jgi:hypothetical protein
VGSQYGGLLKPSLNIVGGGCLLRGLNHPPRLGNILGKGLSDILSRVVREYIGPGLLKIITVSKDLQSLHGASEGGHGAFPEYRCQGR